jgi:acyl-CoA thioester hydrolase
MQIDEKTFRFWHPVDVRFRDIDIGGHAHHAEALTFFEEARLAYWREIAGLEDIADIDFILAEARVRYLQRVLYPDRVKVGVRVSLLGKKHFEMEYLVKSGDGRNLVTGQTVQIMYDYEAGATKRIPEEIRRRIEAAEGLG